MSKSAPNAQNCIDSLQKHKIRSSKEDALSDREFELLLEGAGSLQGEFALQARFIILAAGRLGLRLGELTHIREEWVDWRKSMIRIPRHEPCKKGRDGGICGLCAQQLRQMADHHDIDNAQLDERDWWTPKTEQASRAIPFDHAPRVQIAIERFFEQWNCWPHSHSAIRRRVDKAADAAPEIDPTAIYPHCLRATAASHVAARGLGEFELTAMFGWADLSTAERYVARSPENLARALHLAHSR